MKKSSTNGPNRNIRYSAADKLKAVKLFIEDGYPAKQVSEQFGVSKSSLTQWSRMYREHGAGAFTTPEDVPKNASADPVKDFVAAQIAEHKEAHPDHGVKRITQIFRRFLGLPVSTHQVRQVLETQGLSSPLTPRKPKPSPAPVRFFERHSPNELWHTDVMYFIMPNREKVFVIGYLDDYSRYVVSLDLFHRQTVANTLDLLKKACGDYTFPKEILTDGGRQFVSWTGNNQFGTYLRNHDIKHTVCRSHHPQTNGKMERFWRTLRLEFFDKAKITTFDELKEQLSLYVKHYNFQRPHQGIGGMTPADRFFEIETEVRKRMSRQIAENALEIALKGTVKKPFVMVGRVGDSSVAIIEEKGRLSMQIDGVEHPKGDLLTIDLAGEKLTQRLDKQPIMENIKNGNIEHSGFGTLDFVNETDSESTADGEGEMQGDSVDLDGEIECEFGLPPAVGATPAGGALGGVGIGGDAAGVGTPPEGAACGGNRTGGIVESSGEVAGTEAGATDEEESDAAENGDEAGKSVGSGGKEGSAGTSAEERGPWRMSVETSDISITI
jgi:Transposase and inactivated derivatives